MLDQDKIDFAGIDYGALSPAQWIALKQQAVQRAHAERSQTMRRSLAAVVTPLRWIGAAFAAWRKMRKRRRQIVMAIAELRGLDDLMLKDMGITRGDIVTVVHNDGSEKDCPWRPEAKVARHAA